MSAPEPAAALTSVTRFFGSVRAVDNVTLTVRRGDYVSIMGRSGSGKSTLLNVMGLLDRPTLGHYILDGIDTGSLSNRERALARGTRLGFVFQAFHLLPRLTVLENVLLGLAYSGLPRSRRRTMAQRAIERVAMGHRTEAYPSTLSGGERQRISIARAILHNPRILILDEATASMDTETERKIQASLNSLVKGRTTIIIAHRLSTLRDADYLVVIDEGKMAESGTHSELINKKGIYYNLYKIQTDALKNIGVE